MATFSNELIDPTFVDMLVGKRRLLIDNFASALIQLKTAHSLCVEIDNVLPKNPECLTTMAGTFFITAKDVFKNDNPSFRDRDPLPIGNPSILGMSPEKVVELSIKAVDIQLWDMLFKTMSAQELMDKEMMSTWQADLRRAPIEFSADHVFMTFAQLFHDRENILIQSLMNAILRVSPLYKNNNRFAFQSKTIFKGATRKANGVYYAMDTHSDFAQVLKFLSFFVLGEVTIPNLKQGSKLVRNGLFSYIESLMSVQNGPDQCCGQLTVDLTPVGLPDCKVNLFENGNAHLVLSKTVCSYLNDFLSKSKSLKTSN